MLVTVSIGEVEGKWKGYPRGYQKAVKTTANLLLPYRMPPTQYARGWQLFAA